MDPFDPTEGGELAPWLSADPRKRELYADDIYFREGWTDAGEILGDERRAVFERTALLLFKPEAIVGRRVPLAEPFLHDRGFEPVAARPVQLDRRSARALWGYQINAAPLALVHMIDAVVTAGEALVVLFRDCIGGGPSATSRLAYWKGASRLAGPQPGSLRAAMGSSTLLVNFVHISDEPADMFRELGLLFEQDDRRDLLRAMAGPGGGWAEVHSRTAEMHARSPFHPIDPAPAWAYLRTLAEQEGEPRAPMARAALDAAEKLPDDATLKRIVAWLMTSDLDLGHWDRVILGSQLVVTQPMIRRPLIGKLTLQETNVELPAPAAENP